MSSPHASALELEHELIPIPYREDKYLDLLEDIKGLNALFADLRDLVDAQQEPLDIAEETIHHSQMLTANAERELAKGSTLQIRANRTTTVLFVIVGTVIGVGFSSVGILAGVKPLATILLGGGVGAGLSALFQGRPW